MEQPSLLKELLYSTFKTDIERDFKLIKALQVEVIDLAKRCKERGDQIKVLQSVVGDSLTTQCLDLMIQMQEEDLEKNRTLMRSISETQIKALKTLSFLAKMKRNH